MGDGVGVGDAVAVGVGVGLAVGDGEAVADGDGDGVGSGVSVGTVVGVADGAGVGTIDDGIAISQKKYETLAWNVNGKPFAGIVIVVPLTVPGPSNESCHPSCGRVLSYSAT